MHELCYMLLTCVSLPNYINAFSFLVKQDKHQLQEVFSAETTSSLLAQTSDVFTDFVNKMEIW